MEGRHPSEEAKVASAFLNSPARVGGPITKEEAWSRGRGKPLLYKHHPYDSPRHS